MPHSHAPDFFRSLLSALLLTAILVQQSSQAAVSPQAAAQNSTVPRAPDGHPSLEGTWTNSTATPFERPADLAAHAQLNAAQAAELERRAEDFRTHRSFKATEIGHDNEEYLDVGIKVLPTMQSSLVVEPGDGRVPLTPEAERRRDYNLSNFDSYESMSQWDRCISRGPTSLLPANYNNGYQIVQTPTHIVIMSEMIHEARIIPLTPHPALDARVRFWAGDSRGHWEGTTLVVETTHFNGRGWLVTHAGGGRVRGVPYSESLRIVERFTRTDANTLNYEVTVEDPIMYTKPWKAALPFTRNDEYRIFEYACHEGNGATDALLRGARAQEAQSK